MSKAVLIKENRPAFYSTKMQGGTWLTYLERIDTSAKGMVDKLMNDMAVKQMVISYSYLADIANTSIWQ